MSAAGKAAWADPVKREKRMAAIRAASDRRKGGRVRLLGAALVVFDDDFVGDVVIALARMAAVSGAAPMLGYS